MKILYLHQFFITPDRPGATRSYEMARRLAAAGHEVHVVASDAGWMSPSVGGDRRLKWSLRHVDGIRVHSFPVTYSNKMGFSRRIWSFLVFMVVASVKGASLRADIVYASSAPLTIAIPGMFASFVRRIPMVLEVRDLWPAAPIQMGALRNPFTRGAALLLEKVAYRWSKRVIGLSPGMKDGIVAAGKSDDLVTVIPNSADLDRFRPDIDGSALRSRLDLDGKFVLGYIGTVGLANGIDFVVDAAAELKRRGDKRITFLIVGDGKQLQSLKARVVEEGLTSVVFHDPVSKDDVPEFVAACDVALVIFKNVPILRTCSPNKMFDALAAGKPILTNMPGWLGDLAEKEKTGVLVQPDNPQDFADKAQWMLDNPVAIKTFQVNARKLAEREFSRDELARRLESVLLGVISESKN